MNKYIHIYPHISTYIHIYPHTLLLGWSLTSTHTHTHHTHTHTHNLRAFPHGFPRLRQQRPRLPKAPGQEELKGAPADSTDDRRLARRTALFWGRLGDMGGCRHLKSGGENIGMGWGGGGGVGCAHQKNKCGSPTPQVDNPPLACSIIDLQLGYLGCCNDSSAKRCLTFCGSDSG